MMDSILSILPMGLFGHNPPVEVAQGGGNAVPMTIEVEEDKGRKRARDCDREDGSGGSTTPSLLSASSRRGSEVPSFREEDDVRPVKRFCGPNGVALAPPVADVEKAKESDVDAASPLSSLPEDAVAHCLSFLNSTKDRFALQCTSKQFRRISDSDEMLLGIQIGGDKNTGLNGIIQETDTPDTAAEKLMPFAMAGNLEAVYM